MDWNRKPNDFREHLSNETADRDRIAVIPGGNLRKAEVLISHTSKILIHAGWMALMTNTQRILLTAL